MECHDIRMLLNFARRGCEKLDAAEGDVLHQHLEKCPECAALAAAEQRIDQGIGHVMRVVPVPADLKDKILRGLAAQRGAQPRPMPWKWLAASAVAAALLLSFLGGIRWFFPPSPIVDFAYVQGYVHQCEGADASHVVKYLADQGLQVEVPRMLDYQFLQHVDIVEFKARRVAKLTFFRIKAERSGLAEVLILPREQFRMDDSKEMTLQGSTTIRLLADERFVFVIVSRGEFDLLVQDQN